MSLFSRIKKKLKFIFATRHGIGQVMSFAEYADIAPAGFNYHIIQTGRSTMVCPVQFIGEPLVTSFETPLPDTYWAELTNGIVIGASSVVMSDDGYILYDMLSQRKEYEANMTDNGLFLLGGSPWHIGEHFIYSYLKDNTIGLPSAISLLCNMSNNYYHFILQVASRFYLLSMIDIDKSIPLLVDEKVLETPQMKEILDALNILNRPIVSVKAYQRVKANKLIVISEPNVVVPNSRSNGKLRTENYAFDRGVLDYLSYTLKRRLLPALEQFPKRVFLSRKGCTKRRCNEDELERIYKKFGFEAIKTENLSVAQQIALFRGAEHIIGGSGAAFTNLIFCHEKTNATLFITKPRNITCFSSIGSAKGIRTYYAYPDKKSSDIHVDYYQIDPALLFTHLKEIFG